MTGCSLRATALVHEKACLYRGSADNRNAVTGRHEMEELWMCLFVYVVVDGCRDERLCEQTCYTGRREREGGIQEESKARERERGGERAEEGESWCERERWRQLHHIPWPVSLSVEAAVPAAHDLSYPQTSSLSVCRYSATSDPSYNAMGVVSLCIWQRVDEEAVHTW